MFKNSLIRSGNSITKLRSANLNSIITNSFKRSYYSPFHEQEPIVDLTTFENKILLKAYEDYVPELGFKNESVLQAIKDLGYNSDNLKGMFNFTTDSKNLAIELIFFHLKYQRFKLSDFHEKAGTLQTETERVRYYLGQRLLNNSKIIRHYPNALAQMIKPTILPLSLQELHNLSDDITFYAGDQSNDFAWYTKRFSLSNVFIQSELFMLKDYSKDFHNTLQFMNNRLDEVDKAGYIYNSIEEWALFNGISTINMIKSQLLRG
ncbi:unnamed protein product [[Candida] boidinii]|nr:hypothetical protein BVG19_g3316 [[Candida] boidinii]OWB52143.1 hypothetical protein B5S27_g3715 [[Candida] boidinii]OWB85473.1 hypothetical protein B5S33_g4140 [[Candida] boidinii]GMF05125.1 unnamed protein product [[Candida] boidinii]